MDKHDAIITMNKWGSEKKPFLFIVDFEMENVCLFEYENIPSYILFKTPCFSDMDRTIEYQKSFTFAKSPVPYHIYEVAFDKVKKNILKGNSFLVNLTFPSLVETDLTLKEIFYFSKAKYKLWFNNQFVVFSPETFVKIQNGIIYSYPMKGTINANEPDAENKVLSNEKEKAEHYTIVDLIRNDLSMVATNVFVSRFRYTEKLQTNFGEIIQVSSEIRGELPEDYCDFIGNIIFTLLPAGSICGAPKSKTLKIIKDSELGKRGYYTGVFGYFDGMNLDSAVMIRYIEADTNGNYQFRSGGGITFQSNSLDEYNELINKIYVPFSGNN